MTDDTDNCKNARPSADLEHEIMNSNVPKNDREWWAAEEIARLRTHAEKAEAERDAVLARLEKLEGTDGPPVEQLIAHLDDQIHGLLKELDAARADIARKDEALRRHHRRCLQRSSSDVAEYEGSNLYTLTRAALSPSPEPKGGLPPLGHPEIHTPEVIASLQRPAMELYDDASIPPQGCDAPHLHGEREPASDPGLSSGRNPTPAGADTDPPAPELTNPFPEFERKPGRSKLVYDKAKRTITTVWSEGSQPPAPERTSPRIILQARVRDDGSWFVTCDAMPFYSYVASNPPDWIGALRLLADYFERNQPAASSAGAARELTAEEDDLMRRALLASSTPVTPQAEAEPDYNSAAIRRAGERLLPHSMETARQIVDRFNKWTPQPTPSPEPSEADTIRAGYTAEDDDETFDRAMNKLHEETRRKNTRTIQLLPYLSHDDLCRLSRKFNELADLATAQDNRINQWLREAIAKAEAHEAAIARAQGGKT